MSETDRIISKERIAILGDLGASTFIPWIERHANKLGLKTSFSAIESHRIEMEIEGPEALIDAMEMGCLLGPIDVWVDEILRSSNARGGISGPHT